MEGLILGDRADELGRWSRHFDGAFEKSAEFLSTLGRPNAEAYTEVVTFWVAADERFEKDYKFGSLPGSFG